MRKWLALISLFFMLSSESGVAQTGAIDSLKAVISASPDDTLKVENLIQLSRNLSNSDPPKAIYFATQAKDLAKDIGFDAGLGKALKYIGMVYYVQGQYIETIPYWEQSLAVFESIDDKVGIANMLSNLGVINNDEGDDARALELYLRSLAIAEETGDSLRISTALLNIGLIYSKKPDTSTKALGFYLKAMGIIEKLNDNDALGTVTVNIGELYFAKEKPDLSTALYFFEKSLKAYEGTSDAPYSMNYIGRVYAQEGNFGQALEIQQEALAMATTFGGKLDMAKVHLGIAETFSLQGQHTAALVAYKQANKLAAELRSKEELRDTYTGLALTYSELADYRNAFRYQELLTAIKDTLFYAANQKQLDLIHANADNEKQKGEIDLLTKDKALQDLNLQKERIVKNAFVGGFIVILIIAFVIFRNYRNKVKTNKLLDKQNEEIEELLLNILPAEVAKELQHEGYATPKNYDSATVLFTDFKGFTQISSGLLPHELIAELNSYFNEFDDIIGTHNLEKIKTIGDAYMCAGGIPSANTTHAVDAVEAGLAIQKYIAKKNDKRKAEGLGPWELRIGIHTGPIVAGVVGRKKYAYDIWGDAVNIASRMESNGEACKVNISEATYDLVKDKFKCVARGEILVKGAGEKHMYFVEGPISSATEELETNDLTAK